MSTWLLPRQDLTPEQLRAVELPPAEHRAIFGPPGSGKTQVLIHRAAHLRDRYRVGPKRFHVFVFTNVLKRYIQSSLDMVNLPEDSVTTFAQWCQDMYVRYVDRRTPWNKARRTPDFEAIRLGVLKATESRLDMNGMLDFALVDEGQDLDASSFVILRRVAKHVTVFADHQQQIFEGGATEAQILKALGLSRRNATLLADYRNCPYVAQLASYFIPNDAARATYLAQVKTTQAVRERPLCYVALAFKDEMDHLAGVARQRLTMNQRVGIIVPQVRHVHGLATGLAERGITVEKAVGHRSGRRAKTASLDFDSLVPKIATYHSAKGLTFDCVLMPRLTEDAFPRLRGAARERILFVGVARATQWVYLSTLKGKEIREFAKLTEAEARKHLTIQRVGAAGWQPLSAHQEQPEVGNEFDVL